MIAEDAWVALKAGQIGALSQTATEELARAEVLVPAHEDEVKTVVDRNRAAISSNDELYQVIQPTASCQLACSYCGQEHHAQSLSTADQSSFIARVREKIAGGEYRRLRVGWFGGEPLSGLQVLRSMSVRLQECARESGCSYSSKIVTNGVALTESVAKELVDEHRVQEIEVTLDGLAADHDCRRPTKSGGPSFDRIMANLEALASRSDLDVHVTVRCNVDKSNADGVSLLIEKIATLGSRLSFYVAPVHSWGNDAHLNALSPEDFGAREIEWLTQMISLGMNPRLLPTVRPIVCMAVQPDAELIDAYGNVFNCTEVSYVPKYQETFTIRAAGGEKDDSRWRILGSFNDKILAGKYPCSECAMLPVCGGRCPKQWAEGVAPCPSAKFNIGDRLRLFHAMQVRSAESA